VSAKEFYFALRLPAEPPPRLVRELVSRVCASVSCPPSDAADLIGQVEAAVSHAAAGGACELRFTVHAGALNVAIAFGAAPLWHTSCPID